MSSGSDMKGIFSKAIAEHLQVVRQLDEQQQVLCAIALAMSAAIRSGRKILWCGNGGSAADSQHLAAEIVGRFSRERRALPSIALTTDTSILTAVANDFGFKAVFSRQIEALAVPGDMLVGISSSGDSPNVVEAIETARSQGLVTAAFTGAGGGKVGALADHLFAVNSRNTARIQEAHILAGHLLCDWIETESMSNQAAAVRFLER